MRKTGWFLAAAAILVLTGFMIWLPGVRNAEAADTACCWIAATNQANNRIEAYDPTVADWNSPEALKWSWKPTTALGYSEKEASLWNGPTDAKLKGNVLVTTAGQLGTIAAYPSGTRIWAADLGAGSNPHSIELLPDGNVAVAASDGKWIRVYTASQGPDSHTYAQFNLDFAHATYWDSESSLLWVIGYDAVKKEHIVTALVVGGTPANPTLTEETSRRSILPSPWGHDITPFAGESDKLWVSTNAAVYIYDKTAKTFTTPADGIDRSFVKAVGNMPNGQVVETKPDINKDPAGDCKVNGWCTDTVDFFNPAMTRKATGTAFYKARIWDQPMDARISSAVSGSPVETYYVGRVPSGGNPLPDYFFVQPVQDVQDVQAQADLTFARYVDPLTGRIYVMVTNNSVTEAQNITLRFDPERAIERVTEVSKVSGSELATNYSSRNGTLTAAFTPGESKLYALPPGFRYQVPQQLPQEPPLIGPYTNLALNRTVLASSDYGRSGWFKRAAVDGLRTSTSASNGWTSYNEIKNNHTEWIAIDLGTAYKVSTVDLYPRADGRNAGLGYPTDFTIQLSEDNLHWTTVVVGHQETKPAGMLRYEFLPTQARYVKVEGTNLTRDPNGNYHMQFAEIEVYSRTGSELSLLLSPSKLLVGKSGQLTVVGWNPDGTVNPLDNTSKQFTSSDPAVATVNAQGLVTAHATGTALITATVTTKEGKVETGLYELSVYGLPSPWKAEFIGSAYGLITPLDDGFDIQATGIGLGEEQSGDDLVFMYQEYATTNPITVTGTVYSLYKASSGRDGQAGLMIRGGSVSDPNAPYVYLAQNAQGRIVLSARTERGAMERIEGDYTVFPTELKLAKTGNRFVGYYLLDGVWTPINGNPGQSGISVNMDRNVRAGIAVYSSEASLYSLARFSGIRIE
ncbi:DUF6528 family protein [Paenibacillus sp. HJGM_3]|uniref:DUF6528 family protein n=1 Tax=Paenibacillus sp. HJGM_3 TaxID=3379816 RepID=UPI00385FF0E0